MYIQTLDDLYKNMYNFILTNIFYRDIAGLTQPQPEVIWRWWHKKVSYLDFVVDSHSFCIWDLEKKVWSPMNIPFLSKVPWTVDVDEMLEETKDK